MRKRILLPNMLWLNFVSSLKGFKAFRNTMFRMRQGCGSIIQADCLSKNEKKRGNICGEVLVSKQYSIDKNSIDT